MDDDQLLDAVARGDSGALRELFDRHAPWLASRLRRSLPTDAVEDVLQDSFIAIWRGAGRYQGKGDVGAWMWGIARKQAAMWLRKHARPDINLDPIDPDDPATIAARNVDLEGALAAVGPEGSEQRELVRLVFIEDRSIADVAAQLGIPCGTVKSRVFKVRHLLQVALRKGGQQCTLIRTTPRTFLTVSIARHATVSQRWMSTWSESGPALLLRSGRSFTQIERST